MVYVLSEGFEIIDLSYSPIKGPEGNIEYLLYIEKKPGNTESINPARAQEIFKSKYMQLAADITGQAHDSLDK